MSAPLLGPVAVGAVFLYFTFLLAERAFLRRFRRSVRIVVHVNGTRGKTETTRLIASALREAGIRTLAKTTGTTPLLILPDGSERPIRRWGAANVREQRNFMLLAWRHRVEAVVAECMAVSPGPQAASTSFLDPTILVVTNSRPDHAAELGSPEEAATVFAEGIPAGGTVVTADPSILEVLRTTAEARNTKVMLASPVEGTRAQIAANAGIALVVAELAGVPREIAIQGMRSCEPDPGAFALRKIEVNDGDVLIVDALAANDPISTAMLFDKIEGEVAGRSPRMLLLANRGDRLDRTMAFVEWIVREAARWDAVLVAGPIQSKPRRLLEAAYPGKDSNGRRRVRHLRRVQDLAGEPSGSVIFATGNWADIGPELATIQTYPSQKWAQE
jgi:poly-gamma-glutamate synthase PgsB/CapB